MSVFPFSDHLPSTSNLLDDETWYQTALSAPVGANYMPCNQTQPYNPLQSSAGGMPSRSDLRLTEREPPSWQVRYDGRDWQGELNSTHTIAPFGPQSALTLASFQHSGGGTSTSATPRQEYVDQTENCWQPILQDVVIGSRNSLPDRAVQADSNGGLNPGPSPEPCIAQMLLRCLREAPNQMLSLEEIYRWMKKNSRRIQAAKDRGWHNTVRHNLSQNEAFGRYKKGENPQSLKPVGGWYLKPQFVNGILPTTRYRKDGGKRKAGAHNPPAPSRQRAGARGGKATRDYGSQNRVTRRYTHSKQAHAMRTANAINNSMSSHMWGPITEPCSPMLDLQTRDFNSNTFRPPRLIPVEPQSTFYHLSEQYLPQDNAGHLPHPQLQSRPDFPRNMITSWPRTILDVPGAPVSPYSSLHRPHDDRLGASSAPIENHTPDLPTITAPLPQHCSASPADLDSPVSLASMAWTQSTSSLDDHDHSGSDHNHDDSSTWLSPPTTHYDHSPAPGMRSPYVFDEDHVMPSSSSGFVYPDLEFDFSLPEPNARRITE